MAKKNIATQILLSAEEKRMLNDLRKKQGSSGAEIIRQLIREKWNQECRKAQK